MAPIWFFLAAGCSVHEPEWDYEAAGSAAAASSVVLRGQPPAPAKQAPSEKAQHLARVQPRVKPQRSGITLPVAGERRRIELPALLGLSHQEIARIFGRPSNIERNGASVVWNYDTTHCSLQIVFYGDIENQAYHALQYALADSNGQKPENAGRCLERIRAEVGHGE